MEQTVPNQPPSLRSTLLKIAAALLAGTVAYAALAPYAGFGSGMGPFLLMCVAFLGTWLIICALVSHFRPPTIAGRAAIFVLGFVLTATYFVYETRVLCYAREHLLAHPLFHNDFIYTDKAFLPYWYPPAPLRDEFGQYVQADYERNLLAIALTGQTDEDWRCVINGKSGGFTVDVDNMVELGEMKDALVLILHHGDWKSFPLEPELAKEFEKDFREQKSVNALRKSRELLEPADQPAFDAFVADYVEPIPPRPLFHHEHVMEVPPTSPYWRLTEPLSDGKQNRAWADFIDNFVVIVIESDREQSEPMYQAEGVLYQFASTHKSVQVDRDQNKLVVVTSDRRKRSFSLASGSAEKFYRSHPSQSSDLLEQAAALVPAADQAELRGLAQTRPVTATAEEE